MRPATPLPTHEVTAIEERAPRRRQTVGILKSLKPDTEHSRFLALKISPSFCFKTRTISLQTAVLSLPSSSAALSSPTSKGTSKDSGVQQSEEEEEEMLFRDEDSVFTSITNQPRRDEVTVFPKKNFWN